MTVFPTDVIAPKTDAEVLDDLERFVRSVATRLHDGESVTIERVENDPHRSFTVTFPKDLPQRQPRVFDAKSRACDQWPR